MEFRLDGEQRQIRDAMREFVEAEIEPVARDLDRDREYPAGILGDLGEQGIMGMTVSEEYGGLGYDLVSYAVVIEEFAAGLASIAGAVNTHIITAEMVEKYGGPELKRQWLPDLAAYDSVGAFALTEPNAGSDNTAMETRAKRAGDKWILDGQKRFVTNAPNADVVTVLAKTGPEEDTYHNVSAFLVPTDADGVTVGDPWDTLGMTSVPTCDLFLDDVRIPVDNLVGEQDEGFMYVVKGLNVGRVSHAARSVGLARAALEDAVAYAGEREQFGQSIGEFQGIQFKLADMAVNVDSARLLTRRAAALAERNDLTKGLETSMAKLAASEVAVENALEAIQIHGGVGYTRSYDVERYLRDAKLQTISEGTNEIQRRLIADRIDDEL